LLAFFSLDCVLDVVWLAGTAVLLSSLAAAGVFLPDFCKQEATGKHSSKHSSFGFT
jgi:hypothetical protein